MILIDTSVWVDHFRASERELVLLLDARRVLIHPFVLGELALGNFVHRNRALSTLSLLPHAVVAAQSEVLHLIERHALHGKGIGYVDAHLLASVRLTFGTHLWTRDKRLRAACAQIDLAVQRPS